MMFRRFFRRTDALAPTPLRANPVATDPIDHPALRAMSPGQLADLPFPRTCEA